MASTVYGAFEELRSQLTPLPGEISAASKHRASVLQALRSELDVVTFFQSGSWGNATSVRRHSDVDYFVWLDSELFEPDPWNVLDKVSATLSRRFPKTSVWVDSPADRVNFGVDGSERYEVVPAFLESFDDDDAYIYKIPDPGGGWMLASPDGQRAITVREDERLDGKLRPLIRFLKLWKYANDVPISSYYLEVLATRCVASMETIIYSWDLDVVLGTLHDMGAGHLENLGGVSGTVSACASWERDAVTEAVQQAAVLAGLARRRDEDKEHDRAFLIYNELFSGRFPKRT